MWVQATLLALWGGFCMFDGKAWHFGFQKPLLAGTGAAIITGDITQGVIIAATLELLWLGTNNVGVYTPPDIIAGSIVGVAMGVLSGGGMATGIAVAIPVALLIQQLNIVAQTANIGLAHRADAISEQGDMFSNRIGILHWTGGFFIALTRIVPIFLVVLLGVPVIDLVLSYIPENVLTGLTVASKLVSAVGFAMLLRMLLQKKSWVFLLIGYTLHSYMNVPILGVAMLGVVVAYFYDRLVTTEEVVSDLPKLVTSEGDAGIEKEEYDL